jgi:hypothetical protein
VRSDTDVGQLGLSLSAFQFIPKVFDGVEVRSSVCNGCEMASLVSGVR